MQIISVSGFGYSGSGAVIDYLKGYSNISVFDAVEFQLLHEADGLLDLRYFLSESRERISCNAAINRFLRLQQKGILARVLKNRVGEEYDRIVEDFISNLTCAEWNGRSQFDPEDVDTYSNSLLIRKIQEKLGFKLKKIGVTYPKYKQRYYSIASESKFDECASQFIFSLFDTLKIPYKEKKCVFDMLLSATNPDDGMQFFEDCKCIVVDRNPVDIWAVSKRKDDDYSFMPYNNVKQFVRYYRSMRTYMKHSKNALYIQYEDLIYKYEETTNLISNYLGETDRPTNEFLYFDPRKSAKYTNLENKETIDPQELKYIKENLSEYLYDFDAYKR